LLILRSLSRTRLTSACVPARLRWHPASTSAREHHHRSQSSSQGSRVAASGSCLKSDVAHWYWVATCSSSECRNRVSDHRRLRGKITSTPASTSTREIRLDSLEEEETSPANAQTHYPGLWPGANSKRISFKQNTWEPCHLINPLGT